MNKSNFLLEIAKSKAFSTNIILKDNQTKYNYN